MRLGEEGQAPADVAVGCRLQKRRPLYPVRVVSPAAPTIALLGIINKGPSSPKQLLGRTKVRCSSPPTTDRTTTTHNAIPSKVAISRPLRAESPVPSAECRVPGAESPVPIPVTSLRSAWADSTTNARGRWRATSSRSKELVVTGRVRLPDDSRPPSWNWCPRVARRGARAPESDSLLIR